MAITETWLNPNILDNEIEISGMSLFRHDRERRGGGVALYCAKQLDCRELTDEYLILEDTLWCTVRMQTGDVCVVGVIYRSPSSDESHNSRLFEVIRLVASKYKARILIMGDFNLPNLLRKQVHPVDSIESTFCDLLLDAPLYNCIVSNTRYRGDDIPSTLDLVLTSEENVTDNILYETPLGLSDHIVLIFEYICDAKRASDGHKMLRKINMAELSSNLQGISDWNLECADVTQQWINFSQKLNFEIERHSHYTPKRDRRVCKFKIRSRTRKWIKTRNAAWANHRLNTTADSWEVYRLLRNKVNKLVLDDRQKYQAGLMSQMERNPKVLYQFVNSHSAVKPGVSALANSNGMTTTASETAEVLAKFYSTVFCPRECVSISIEPQTPPIVPLNDVTVSPHLVLAQLLALNTRKSPGADEITPYLLRHCAQPLCIPLTFMFNQSLSHSVVPPGWKCGIISPIFKSGKRSQVSNYRPVTLLPVISKVLERLIVNRIVDHFENNKLYATEQHGFRKNHSCLSNLLLTLNDWTEVVDRGSTIHVCYIDISKAFDRVNHSILVQKLEQYGVGGNLLKWLKNYLNDRTVQVRVDGALSMPIQVTSGVPQGSVLGPILFLIYANDIPRLIQCKIILFADDMKIWTTVNTTEDCERLQKDLDALHDWSLRNRLPFNFDKCKTINIGKTFPFDYTLGPHQLVWATQERDLGVWIANNLKTSKQCTESYRKTSKKLALLKRIFGRFTKQTFPRLINTYIRPSMEYCVQAWSPWLQKDIFLMQRIYHRATKLVIGLQHHPYDVRIRKLNLFDFRYRQIRGDLILAYKILHTPEHPLQNMLVLREAHTTRAHNFTLCVPHSRMNCRRHFYAIRVCFTWNSLPANVVQATNLTDFKAKLDVFLTGNFIFEPSE